MYSCIIKLRIVLDLSVMELAGYVFCLLSVKS